MFDYSTVKHFRPKRKGRTSEITYLFPCVLSVQFSCIVRKADIFNFTSASAAKRERISPPTRFFTVIIIPTRVNNIKKNNFLHFILSSGNNSTNRTRRWFCLYMLEYCARQLNASLTVPLRFPVVICRTRPSIFLHKFETFSRCVNISFHPHWRYPTVNADYLFTKFSRKTEHESLQVTVD